MIFIIVIIIECLLERISPAVHQTAHCFAIIDIGLDRHVITTRYTHVAQTCMYVIIYKMYKILTYMHAYHICSFSLTSHNTG